MTLEDTVVRSMIDRIPQGVTLGLDNNQCLYYQDAGPAATYVKTVQQETARIFLKASDRIQNAVRDTTSSIDSQGRPAVYYLVPVAWLPGLMQWHFNANKHLEAPPTNLWTGVDRLPG
ncbi:hypothetical protein [Paraburkholderia terricola]|uniref:Uncharacterized protein n=1 Tax=Paraburkholderia terricola TaxID=169427 RepID=A0A1M6XF42_9BURK|nr:MULTISPECIES: hypothetical protein [Paraburkholderia]SDP40034.1 hypothetical protein SAMN05192547_107310 [Paraburkholderia sediminicola]SHL04604.1 hypothetical protein SAMN05192548_105537 [Paraburkholderia terricola]